MNVQIEEGVGNERESEFEQTSYLWLKPTPPLNRPCREKGGAGEGGAGEEVGKLSEELLHSITGRWKSWEARGRGRGGRAKSWRTDLAGFEGSRYGARQRVIDEVAVLPALERQMRA